MTTLETRLATALAVIGGLTFTGTDQNALEVIGTIYTVAHEALGTCPGCQRFDDTVKPLIEALKVNETIDVDKELLRVEERWKA